MRIKAYVLAADPAWLQGSVTSYYDLVDEILVSYDTDGCGWTGKPVPVDVCLNRLREVDKDGKMRFVPGRYFCPRRSPMENDTYQRQCCIDELSGSADWIVQVDTDEVVMDLRTFASCITEAGDGQFGAVEMPQRLLVCHISGNRFVEARNRYWRLCRGFYPGPVAVRAGARLKQARRCEERAFHVDFQPARPGFDSITLETNHRVVSKNQGVAHYSWVRTEAEMRRKLGTWSHAKDGDWGQHMRIWNRCRRHPLLAMVTNPFIRKSCWKFISVSTIRPVNTYCDPRLALA
ncbi:MAG: hypothetical protein ACAH95_08485 [Fimbriimonas sp.]